MPIALDHVATQIVTCPAEEHVLDLARKDPNEEDTLAAWRPALLNRALITI